jgi:hypothetical protein
MSSFPGSPRVTKGAIVGLDVVNPLASVIVFQYNPDSVTRRLTASAAPMATAPIEQLRLKGPPEENINFELEIDAVDQLERADPRAVQSGIAPALASLELLLYPKAALAMANAALTLAGLIEVVPVQAPLVLLILGAQRVLPVRITELSITEEAFDPALNPIRARVDLGVRVLTYDDLGLPSVGGGLFLAHQIAKEAMATVNSVGSLGSFTSATLGSAG